MHIGKVSGQHGKDRHIHVAKMCHPTAGIRPRTQHQMTPDNAKRRNPAQNIYSVESHYFTPPFYRLVILHHPHILYPAARLYSPQPFASYSRAMSAQIRPPRAKWTKLCEQPSFSVPFSVAFELLFLILWTRPFAIFFILFQTISDIVANCPLSFRQFISAFVQNTPNVL